MPAIRCTDLVKEYHTQKTVRALDGVGLDVQEGEVFGLLGPNGAGKTTLVRILATLLRATGGTATVGGYDVQRQENEVRRIIGYAGQDSERSAYFRLTVRENLLYFGHALRQVPLATARQRIDELAEGVGFTDLLGTHFSALSGGQKQLVIVMRSLLHRPRIVFMDEPSKSLDPVTAERVKDFVLGHAREHGMTILLTTHNMREAEEFCQRLAFINHGRLRFVGTPTEFRRAVTVQEAVEVGLPGDHPLRARLEALGSAAQAVNGSALRLYGDDGYDLLRRVMHTLDEAEVRAAVRMVEPSLEDAFSIMVRSDEEAQHD
jgi:ABC-2 type transport system ATP-binding protein